MTDMCNHEWQSGNWGVIIGVSRCKRCGELARAEHFERPEPDERPAQNRKAGAR